jgi:hypothetical protein
MLTRSVLGFAKIRHNILPLFAVPKRAFLNFRSFEEEFLAKQSETRLLKEEAKSRAREYDGDFDVSASLRHKP